MRGRSMRTATLASLIVIAACGKHAERSAPAPAPAPAPKAAGPIHVPRPRAPIPIDGEWETDWNDRAARVVFHVRGGDAEARPYSEMRMLRDGDALLVGLYAADEEIHSNEFFAVK